MSKKIGLWPYRPPRILSIIDTQKICNLQYLTLTFEKYLTNLTQPCLFIQGASFSSSSAAAAVEVVEIDSGPSSAKKRATEDNDAAQETDSKSAQVR